MSEISEFADRHLFPAVYERADQIFPEFGFVLRGDKWISSNKRKVDGGTDGNKVGAVYIYQDRPYYIKDYRQPGKAITTYLQEQGICSSWIEAIEYLASKVGVQLPERKLSEEVIEAFRKKDKQAGLFETMNDFFITGLLEEKGSDADSVRKHLNEDRGYTEYLPKTQDDIGTSNNMEIGFIPSRDKLKNHLKDKELDPKEFDDLFTKGIGTTHKLVIPLRCLGHIVGFAFRNIDHKEGQPGKYLYSSTPRDSFLFGFKRPKKNNRELILVEGLLDVMYLQAQGIDNIAALGSCSLNSKQMELIKNHGYEKITLCLDNDTSGREGTTSIINATRKRPDIKTYVAVMPNDFKDPDELVRHQGLNPFQEIIKNARTWHRYLFRQRFDRFNEVGEIPDKDRDDLIQEIIDIGSDVKSSDLDLFENELATLGEKFNISPATIRKEILFRQERNIQATQDKAIKQAIIDAKGLVDAGSRTEALDLLNDAVRQCKSELNKTKYEELFRPVTREDIGTELQQEGEYFDTGLKIRGESLLFPSGALSFIAGRPGRGKTASKINFTINALRDNDPRPIVFITYEERRVKILMKILNTYIGKNFSDNNRACIYHHYKNKKANFLSESDRKLFIEKENEFFDLIASGKLIVIDSRDSAEDLIDLIHYLHREKRVRAVFIDYIQRIKLKSAKKSYSRYEELKEICDKFADCAFETGLPIIMGSQFNRQATDDRDTLTINNLSEAGDIERIANIVIAVDIKHNTIPSQPSEFWVKFIKNRDGRDQIYDEGTYEGNTGKISNKLEEVRKFGSR